MANGNDWFMGSAENVPPSGARLQRESSVGNLETISLVVVHSNGIRTSPERDGRRPDARALSGGVVITFPGFDET